MAASVLYMLMSLDGYIADPDDRLGGEDGNRLHAWALTLDGEFSWPAGLACRRLFAFCAPGSMPMKVIRAPSETPAAP